MLMIICKQIIARSSALGSILKLEHLLTFSQFLPISICFLTWSTRWIQGFQYIPTILTDKERYSRNGRQYFCFVFLLSFFTQALSQAIQYNPKLRWNDFLHDLRLEHSFLAYMARLSRNFKPGFLLFMAPTACLHCLQNPRLAGWGWISGKHREEESTKLSHPFPLPSRQIGEFEALMLWTFFGEKLRSLWLRRWFSWS